MRKLVVGDIHGNYRGLLNVLDACNYNKEYDQLIFLGDYVDGWSESFEVVDFLIDLQSQAICKPIFIRGNHDVWAENFLRGRIDNHWLTQGGKATLDSYRNNQKGDDIDRHYRFFKYLHDYYVDDQNRGFVHGGFTSRKGLGHEPSRDIYYWDRDLWTLVNILNGRESEANNIGHATRFNKHSEVFIGHTSTCNWNCKPHYPEFNDPNQPSKNGPITVPMKRCNVWNLDTGGGFNGRLTIMDVDSKDYWQAEPSMKLYPGEMSHYKKNK
jgi:serine/threonine protein phosphatase 1